MYKRQVKDAFKELKSTGRVDPERYGTRWDVASLMGLDDIYELERKFGTVEVTAD